METGLEPSQTQLSMPVISQIALPQTGTDRVTKLYQITIRGANILFIVDENLILVDTAFRGSSAELDESLKSVGYSINDIDLVILTHNHIDHVGGLSELKYLSKAMTAIHKNDIGERMNLPSASHDNIDIVLEGGESFQALGGLEVIHTPGHTPGSICLFSPTNGLLIAGDAIRKRRDILRLPFKTSHYDRVLALDSIRRISSLNLNILCLGHGLPITNGINDKISDLLTTGRD